MNRNYLIFLVVMTCMVCVRCGGDDRGDFIEGIVNFSHLEHLTELVTDDAGDFAIVHIYAEHPSYEWVDAEGEGVACVDDVARAIVVYLMHYEATRDSLYLASVRPLFNFLLMMQCEDGEFYNFLDQGYEINRNGITSRKSFNFWAVRAYWALACGCRIFSEIDNDYTNLLEKAFLRCKVPLSRRLENYHRYTMLHDRRYPVWLVSEYGSDASAVMILAIYEYLGFRADSELENFADQLADGICEMQVVHESIHSGAF
ncbi:hypothetical protein JXB12_06085, partial [candidate division KSB1 bacterium]|nr:hypothetical protein [candidate division KSB1 bacterium]